MDKVIQWLTDYFATKVELPADYLTMNYFESGFIDSMDVIFLINDIELEFDITLTEEHFQDRRFATIQGLSEIIFSTINT
ncbi:hypothetical protein tinsulaeT_09810 [Thalassotalea insulae]|uniref:Carrier domain-containing protein n=1 Tax=Thalassotalea insulae TaxID=2056778 RepID=A0ABQ6GSH8_9GAMM|nr:phosphopantetheine-binding protein [Thalassotalea insulae]GLX77641.1 hypothetical protein tinsulaeT_09810 [Thalassotalea insulae]